mmetsp:Transcript_18779/g.63348  ORF Transcript_18779/g.63348 Transcript_18779/m.63348 type:complete len:159 (+) Transcript_18779:763-1239(+)
MREVGSSEEASLLPASWQEGPTWQAHTYMLFDQLHIGQDFAVTTCGTTVFQYILNAVTFVLLTKGRSSSLGDMARFMVGGMGGTLGSGMAQFGKTLFMRTGYLLVRPAPPPTEVRRTSRHTPCTRPPTGSGSRGTSPPRSRSRCPPSTPPSRVAPPET